MIRTLFIFPPLIAGNKRFAAPADRYSVVVVVARIESINQSGKQASRRRRRCLRLI